MDAKQIKQLKPMLDKYLRQFDDCFGRIEPTERLKAYVMEVNRTTKGPQVLLSRAHRNLLRRLLELEVPEIHSGVVELKAIAREAGHRSKIAVAARQQGIDPVGSCVGLRGIRIQNIVNELNGEKIDIVEWHPDPATFIANALSPAQVSRVEVDNMERTAIVVVPDRQLSLAIGKEGQNARLAAKLTGWRIDIKSTSAAEAEVAAILEEPPLGEPVAEAIPDLPVPLEVEEPHADVHVEPVVDEQEGEAAPIEEVAEEPLVPVVESAPQIRFAEDIFIPIAVKPDRKKSKKSKAGFGAGEKSVLKPKKARPARVAHDEEEELEEQPQ